MKNTTLILIVLFACVSAVFGQNYYTISFDTSSVPTNPAGANFALYRDTVSNPNTIWQIGAPQKSVFTEAVTAPNCIITDTANSYPINDQSAFILRHIADMGLTSFWFELHADYQVHSDTLTDYGMLELSVDNGLTWIDLFTDPALSAAIQWDDNGLPPVLSGNSNGWRSFGIYAESSALAYLNIESGDTLLFRFSFVSDGNQTFKDGLMFDNISIRDTPPIGIQELSPATLNSTLYPNPAREKATIAFENPASHGLLVEVRDNSGKLVLKTVTHHAKQMVLNTEKLVSGTYFYTLTDQQTGAVASHIFVVR